MARLPLPIRDGLNPSRIAAPGRRGDAPTKAWDLLYDAIFGQRHRHPDDDESAIAKRFADGEVVTGQSRPISPQEMLKPGTEMWFYRVPAPEPQIAGAMPIVHADDNIVVVDKPAFLATMPRGRHITETAVVRLRRELDNPELVPAHRLDRMTSGLLIFTARKEVRGAYQTLFATGGVVKRYHALTHIVGRNGQELPRVPLKISTRQNKVAGELQATTLEGEANAHTIVEAVEVLRNVALWRLRPITGRTHQLRLHLCEQGFPILGDQVYPLIQPVDAEDPAHPLHLLCAEMEFTDPLSGAHRHFRSIRNVFRPLDLACS